MATGVTLESLLNQLRLEVGDSTNPALGLARTGIYKQYLERTQKRLYEDFNWPQLIVDREQTLQKGERYYTFPADLDFSKINRAWVYWNNNWNPIKCGFDPVTYNDSNPALNTRSDPIQVWRYYETNQFEVWPMPAASSQVIRFRGMKTLDRLTADSDRAVLDDTLLVLYSAAELLARSKAEDAPAKLSQAQNHYLKLKSRLIKSQPFIIGGGMQTFRTYDDQIRVNPL